VHPLQILPHAREHTWVEFLKGLGFQEQTADSLRYFFMAGELPYVIDPLLKLVVIQLRVS